MRTFVNFERICARIKPKQKKLKRWREEAFINVCVYRVLIEISTDVYTRAQNYVKLNGAQGERWLVFVPPWHDWSLTRRSIRWTSSVAFDRTARSSTAFEKPVFRAWFTEQRWSPSDDQPSSRGAELHCGIFFPRSRSRAKLKAIGFESSGHFYGAVSAVANCHFSIRLLSFIRAKSPRGKKRVRGRACPSRL